MADGKYKSKGFVNFQSLVGAEGTVSANYGGFLLRAERQSHLVNWLTLMDTETAETGGDNNLTAHTIQSLTNKPPLLAAVCAAV